jgi:hypothetical protein
MTHTPTPWEWRNDQTYNKGQWSIMPGVLIVEGTDGTPDGDEIDRANAAFIVRAVNAHDKLVEALRRALDEAVADEMDEWYANAKAALEGLE